ncbi:MAG: YggS family pyridoxal phosphate-dependent enzyme [Candidatus Dormibacteraeota bacterium]|nr:YggS family pyridoxal phosphate-dependent enzyme [Candidatus Dormibacteraeota bacterium]
MRTVRERIERAATGVARDPASVRLVAVTKGVDAARVSEAIASGAADIGENRVQEAEGKRDAVTLPAAWHLIGHLQTNKAKRAAELFDAVHSVDSERVARALSTHRNMESDPLPVLIEVDLTGIEGRTGVAPDEAHALARAVAGMPAIHLVGLMTIAPPLDDADAVRPYFRRLCGLRDQLEHALSWTLPELSMGMTDDFEVAIEEGATIVRVGRGIFGERG